MSVRAQSHIWQYSKAKGGPLLVLLAIGDWAHDDGTNAWPSVATLAAKSRMTERAVRLILRQLEAAGELRIRKNEDGIAVQNGHVPAKFLDVLCVKPLHPQETEKISGRGKKRGSEQTEKISATQTEKIAETTENISDVWRKNSAEGVQDFSETTEKTCTPLKEDPSVDPSVDPLEKKTHDAGASLFALNGSGDERTVLRIRFERVCAVYPRVTKKNRTWRAFQKLNPTEAITEHLLADIERKKRTVWGGVEPKFIPSLINYIVEERWTDDVTDVAPYSAVELAEARRISSRRFMGRCPHNPACASFDDCLKTIARREREQRQPRRRSA